MIIKASVNYECVSLLLATTSCTFLVSRCPSAVAEHLYLPSSSDLTSVKLADLSHRWWDEKVDEANEGGRRPGADLERNPVLSLSQRGSEGIKPGENTQGRVTADPTAAYTLVLSVDGWTIPVKERERGFYRFWVMKLTSVTLWALIHSYLLLTIQEAQRNWEKVERSISKIGTNSSIFRPSFPSHLSQTGVL